jgi:hypothetical protein
MGPACHCLLRIHLPFPSYCCPPRWRAGGMSARPLFCLTSPHSAWFLLPSFPAADSSAFLLAPLLPCSRSRWTSRTGRCARFAATTWGATPTGSPSWPATSAPSPSARTATSTSAARARRTAPSARPASSRELRRRRSKAGVVLRWRRSEAGVEERGLVPGRRGGVLLPWRRSEVAAAAVADSKSVRTPIFPCAAPLFRHF